MKKKSLLWLFLLAAPLSLEAATGDVNGDNSITIIDALMTAQYYVGLNVPDFNAGNADMNGDGQISIVDALIMAQIYVGLVLPTPTPVSYDLLVARDGSGHYSSVQSAINAAPNNSQRWYTIFIKSGTYREVINIPSSKTFLRLVGENPATTILTYDKCSSDAGGTSASASTFVYPSDFMAENLTFENAFDYNNSTAANKQAVALEPMGQRQIYLNCRITGHQDTLYLRNQSRTYFKDCFIQGHTDFIFGDGTAVFNNCEIRSRNRSGSSITAPATLASAAYGLIFLDCHLTADSGLAANSIYLGRPWHPSSSTVSLSSNAVFLYCRMDSHISQKGWTSMSGVYPDTERMWEYQNTGSGAVINASRPQITASQAYNYTVFNILRGNDNWDPESVIASNRSY